MGLNLPRSGLVQPFLQADWPSASRLSQTLGWRQGTDALLQDLDGDGIEAGSGAGADGSAGEGAMRLLQLRRASQGDVGIPAGWWRGPG